MKPLRIIVLAASLVLIALCGLAGQIAPDTHVANAKATPAASWPWSPNGGDPGPFALPAQMISVPAKTPLARWTYDWPLKPFDRPHPVRGYLDDPRITRTSRRAPSTSGSTSRPHRARRSSRSRQEPPVSIARPSMSTQESARSSTGTSFRLSGRASGSGGTPSSVEPVQLQPRSPFRAAVRPVRQSSAGRRHRAVCGLHHPDGDEADLRTHGHRIDPGVVRGAVNLVADAADIASDVTPTPWPVTPALLRWRVLKGGTVVVRWRVACDFQRGVLRPTEFATVYADGTRMNHPGRPGYYCFYLAHNWRSASLANGSYRLEVAASDMRGNLGLSVFPITVAN